MSKREPPSSEFRELKASFDALQKDVKKKDARNDAIAKELITVRTAASSQQVRDFFDLVPLVFLVVCW